MGQLPQETLDGIVIDGTVLQETETLDETVTLGHNRWDNYFRTQWMGQTNQDTVDGTVTLRHNRQESYITTQQMGQLLCDTTDLDTCS